MIFVSLPVILEKKNLDVYKRQELLDDIEAKWLKKHKPKNPNSFTEQLQLRTQTRMMAEEIVIMDVVTQFH